MARFLKHTSCKECGSSDANALYDDGSSWCFSCHYYVGPRFGLRTQAAERPTKSLPDDCTNHYAGAAVEWASRYGLDPLTLIKHNVVFSPSRNQIIFTWPKTNVWQARNLYKDAKCKYFTSGNHNDMLPIYYCGKPVSSLVLVEDCLSAIKIASAGPFSGLWSDAMPLLGSHLPTSKLNGLKRLYSNVVIWLDHDKGKEAQKIARQASILGLSSKVVFTELDPKEYPYEQLQTILNGASAQTN